MRVTKGWTIVCLLVSVMVLPSLCLAEILGECTDCHTMHNSQEGAPVAFIIDSSGKQHTSVSPLLDLLKTDCIGCHSSAGTDTIVQMYGTDLPIVLNFLEPNYPADKEYPSSQTALAGGNFHWVLSDGDAYGHNVKGISGEDVRFPSTDLAPGGVEPDAGNPSCNNCHNTLATLASGCEGCHVASHHLNKTESGVVVGQDSGWYRFLGSVMRHNPADFGPPDQGVVGIEDPAWEQAPRYDRHNVYQAASANYTSYLESGSIDQKCYGCHGLFHDNAVTGVWLRHPVNVSIPSTDEYGYTTYNPDAPVARLSVAPSDVNFSAIQRGGGGDKVSCLSCHRPHGSPYPAMLRWGYRYWPGTDPHTGQPAFNGCTVCHTSKS